MVAIAFEREPDILLDGAVLAPYGLNGKYALTLQLRQQAMLKRAPGR